MLTPTTNLKEAVSVVPGNPRQFYIDDEGLLGIDLNKAVAARTFTGVLLKSSDDASQTDGTTCKFIEVFYEGGINVTTLFTEELRRQLFKDMQ